MTGLGLNIFLEWSLIENSFNTMKYCILEDIQVRDIFAKMEVAEKMANFKEESGIFLLSNLNLFMLN